ncbi:MAG: hypothetical protein HOW73_47230 [Polyangiaceae bacterium]|nr:hypothetical protein [Polyangiaceae bacterium]
MRRALAQVLVVVTISLAGCSGDVEIACNSEPEILEGAETGFATCGSLKHRPEQATCPILWHEAPAVCAGDDELNDCAEDADCDEAEHGICDVRPAGGCGCSYGCASDDDCSAFHACVCGTPRGVCVVASCTTDADCHESSLCVLSRTDPCEGGTPPRLSCLTTRDQCLTDADCDAALCVLGIDGVRTCQGLELCVSTPVP